MTLHVFNDVVQEEWRATPGYDGYEVSNLGRVRSYRAHGGNRGGRLVETPRMKTTRRHNNGYLVVVLQAGGKSPVVAVHTLVASAFLGPRPDGYQVAHADGNRLNARLDNLRYATPAENARDKLLHGTAPIGERNGNRTLTEEQVREIIARYRAGELQRDLAADFGVCQSSISNVVRRERWPHVEVA